MDRRIMQTIVALAACVFAGIPLSGQVIPQLSGDTVQESPTFVCSVSRPVVPAGDTVRLRVYNTDAAASSQVNWSVPGGVLETDTAGTIWRLSGLGLGSFSARVAYDDGAGLIRTCVITVQVVQPSLQLMGSSLAGRAYLLPNQTEEAGFGLYSYIIMRVPPNAATRERYLNAISEYLRQIASVNALRRYVSTENLNIMYLPLRRRIANPNADSLLAIYDYARAQVLLSQFRQVSGDGPFLLGTRTPLSSRSAETTPVIVHDLSAVPPHLVGLWVAEYLTQTAQERYWEENTLRQVSLKLRTIISVLGQGVPDVQSSLDSWIKWIR
jgi:hypothetical protein